MSGGLTLFCSDIYHKIIQSVPSSPEIHEIIDHSNTDQSNPEIRDIIDHSNTDQSKPEIHDIIDHSNTDQSNPEIRDIIDHKISNTDHIHVCFENHILFFVFLINLNRK